MDIMNFNTLLVLVSIAASRSNLHLSNPWDDCTLHPSLLMMARLQPGLTVLGIFGIVDLIVRCHVDIFGDLLTFRPLLHDFFFALH